MSEQGIQEGAEHAPLTGPRDQQQYIISNDSQLFVVYLYADLDRVQHFKHSIPLKDVESLEQFIHLSISLLIALAMYCGVLKTIHNVS